MPKRKGSVETIVGVFVLASLGLLLVIVVLIGRTQNIFEGRYEITGVFESVGGLQNGAEVHLAGILVGNIGNIEFGPSNKVEVVMSVSKRQMERIRADSVACIRTMGLMGDRFVEITIGSKKEPVIPDGGTIRTSELFELGEFLESAQPTLRNVENAVENISHLTDELADPTGEVGTILENIKVLTTGMREGQGTIGALFTRDDLYQRAGEVLDTTQETMDNFEVISVRGKEASEKLPAIMEEVKSSVESFDRLTESAGEAAAGVAEMVNSGKEAMADAKVMASNLKSASHDIKEATRKVGPLIDSTDEGINEARNVIEAAKRNWLVRGYFEPAVPGEPIVLSGRDVAEPEVTK